MQYSMTEACKRLPRLVREAEVGDDVQLTRNGRPVARVISTRPSVRESSEASSGGGGFWEAYQGFRQKYDLKELDLDPDELFREARDPSGGQRPQIAAIAKVNGLVVVTANRRHFEIFDSVEIEDWTQIGPV
jgi:prevent-host-death family protein